ncbi:DNA/RNA non-specific endonuclease [Enterococcus faecalis]|nr:MULTISPECIES: DNA/RNA non-specific endonuclease [Enterococcus]MBU5553662.1 DNA/RNA non-specific endonuclease [Enterococcus sp. S157_ASV_20]EKC6709464.1 DNA/RNA non-specific endonuclease [Enterococcus faecalis]EKC6735998.1 DNA/RNA non-specific endonuclease [Enterococcus faecalis]EKC6780702.1 DNA/RNA non-specific endonuclease [Enterococcus faecalis]EKZ0055085.1 DNA/RNA non-specific endonuclease [Enterococcus faecalis]
MKMTKKQKYLVSYLLAVLFASFGVVSKTEVTSWISQVQSHETEQAITGKQDHKEVSKTNNSSTAPYSQDQYDQLANLDFQSGGNAILNVNNGQSMLNIANWKENKVIYGDLDSLNRTTFVTAYLDRKNLGRSEGRERQVWQPTGWHQKQIDGDPIVNRGHLLAYTSSFNFDIDGNFKIGENGSQDNPKNLATQTAFSNQKVQTHYEKLVRDAQKIKGNKVIYQIVTVFRGKELMPRGYWLQAVDSAGTLNLNVYEYNVQPNVVFNYEDGTSKIDRAKKVRKDT